MMGFNTSSFAWDEICPFNISLRGGGRYLGRDGRMGYNKKEITELLRKEERGEDDDVL